MGSEMCIRDRFKAIEANKVLLAIALVIFAIGIVQSLRHSYRKSQAEEAGTLAEFEKNAAAKVSRSAGIMSAPIALACAIVIALSCASFAKATVSQADSYSVGKGNVASLRGNTCALADQTMVETNTNDSFLTPVEGDLGDSLVDQDETHKGFDPNFIPESIEPENQNSASVGAIADGSSDSSSDSAETATSGADTESGGNSDSADSQETKNKQDKKDKKSKETTNTSEGGVRLSLIHI